MSSAVTTERTKTLITGEAIVAYRRVKMSGGYWVYADADDIEDGVSTDDVSSGGHLAATLRNVAGTRVLELSSSCSQGDLLYGADDGKLSTTKTGPVLYKAMAAASGTGSEIECMPIDLAGGALLSSLVAAGTSVENTTTETALATKTIDGNILQAGDEIEVSWDVWVEDENGSDTLTVKLYFGTEEIWSSGAVNVVDDDHCIGWARIGIRTIGSSGTIKAHGAGVLAAIGQAPVIWTKDVATESTAVDVAISLKATWSAAHADNECQAEQFTVVLHR